MVDSFAAPSVAAISTTRQQYCYAVSPVSLSVNIFNTTGLLSRDAPALLLLLLRDQQPCYQATAAPPSICRAIYSSAALCNSIPSYCPIPYTNAVFRSCIHVVVLIHDTPPNNLRPSPAGGRIKCFTPSVCLSVRLSIRPRACAWIPLTRNLKRVERSSLEKGAHLRRPGGSNQSVTTRTWKRTLKIFSCILAV